MRKLGYLVVEGPHDVEFVARLLRDHLHVVRVSDEAALDPRLTPLVPRRFPYEGNLLRRVPVPAFLQNEALAIAVHAAGGDSRIAESLVDSARQLSPDAFDMIGAILDSDSWKTPQERHARLLSQLDAELADFPECPGSVLDGEPRCGIYVLPDNLAQGTLEDLLLECGEAAYPLQIKAAREFVAAAVPHCPKGRFRDLHLPSGEKKAVVGAVANLLRPGKAVQMSIHDNDWLGSEGIKTNRLSRFIAFLVALFGPDGGPQNGRLNPSAWPGSPVPRARPADGPTRRR